MTPRRRGKYFSWSADEILGVGLFFRGDGSRRLPDGTNDRGGVVGIERRQSMSSLISASQVDRSAALAYGKVISEAGKKNQLNRDSAQVERVRGVANRLIPSTAAFRADAPRWNWEVNVITSPEVNAWCMPGGKIAVYSGLLTKLDPTDEELAAVMGHEIAHALREHGRERASEPRGQQLRRQRV